MEDIDVRAIFTVLLPIAAYIWTDSGGGGGGGQTRTFFLGQHRQISPATKALLAASIVVGLRLMTLITLSKLSPGSVQAFLSVFFTVFVLFGNTSQGVGAGGDCSSRTGPICGPPPWWCPNAPPCVSLVPPAFNPSTPHVHLPKWRSPDAAPRLSKTKSPTRSRRNRSSEIEVAISDAEQAIIEATTALEKVRRLRGNSSGGKRTSSNANNFLTSTRLENDCLRAERDGKQEGKKHRTSATKVWQFSLPQNQMDGSGMLAVPFSEGKRFLRETMTAMTKGNFSLKKAINGMALATLSFLVVAMLQRPRTAASGSEATNRFPLSYLLPL